MTKKAGKKKEPKMLGYGKPTTVEIRTPIYTGAVIVDAKDRAEEVLDMMEDAIAAIKPVQDFIAEARKQTTAYATTNDVRVIQLEGRYWRLIQRFSKRWIARPGDMPKPKPKGAKSLREIVEGKKAGDKSLWNFITVRVPEPTLIDLAVKKGYISENEIGKAHIEAPQTPFLQRFEGEAMDGDDE
jgi:hypothetical protein